jgi:phosphatidylserine decarboxylase
MSKHYTAVLSSLFGAFAGKAFSPSVQKVINRTYVKMMGLDMSEFDTPESYPTLNALFTRSLRKERPIAEGRDAMIAPADSRVTHFGRIRDGDAWQIKGMAYPLDELLGPHYEKTLEPLEGGEFINFYLSPSDYHRYHSPMDLRIVSLTHIPGKLYPVNMPLLRNKLNLFIENERVVIECRDSEGAKHYLVLVGALNVGKMVVTFEEQLKTNACAKERSYYHYETPIKLQIGELFGWFEMGSTILMFSEKERVAYNVPVGKKVSFGEPIGKFLER